MSAIRSLNIRRDEKPLNGQRLAIHMAQATSRDSALPKSPRPPWRVWHVGAWAMVIPSGGAVALIAAWAILHWGLR